MKKNIGLILAGGSGTRMGKVERPKQFLKLGTKPVLIHTLEAFVVNQNIDAICIVSPREWLDYTTKVLDKYGYSKEGIYVTAGGDTRNESIKKGCCYMGKMLEGSEIVVVSHDAVRPFVNQRMINENLKLIERGKSVNTVIKAIDTIVKSTNGEIIAEIPNRDFYYQGQTPQTFYLDEFLKLYEELHERTNQFTDACGMFNYADKEVKLVEGEQYNMKITTLFDLTLANHIVKVDKNDK